MDSATAKQFFISKVVGEAEFEGLKLSEVVIGVALVVAFVVAAFWRS